MPGPRGKAVSRGGEQDSIQSCYHPRVRRPFRTDRASPPKRWKRGVSAASPERRFRQLAGTAHAALGATRGATLPPTNRPRQRKGQHGAHAAHDRDRGCASDRLPRGRAGIDRDEGSRVAVGLRPHHAEPRCPATRCGRLPGIAGRPARVSLFCRCGGSDRLGLVHHIGDDELGILAPALPSCGACWPVRRDLARLEDHRCLALDGQLQVALQHIARLEHPGEVAGDRRARASCCMWMTCPSGYSVFCSGVRLTGCSAA